MRRRPFDLIAVLVVAAAALALVLSGSSSPVLRTIFALPLVLLLPGYALTAALFPNRTLSIPECSAFSLGLSLAIAAFGGLLLNWTPWGLQATSWAVLLASVTLGASLIALLRRRGRPATDPGWPSARLRLHHVLMFGLAAWVAIAAIAVARVGALRQSTPGFTQLWILPTGETGQDAVRVGVYSLESSAKQYRLLILASGRVVREWPMIELEPKGTWETTVVLPAWQSEAGTVEAVLSLIDAPEAVYRRVTLSRRNGG